MMCVIFAILLATYANAAVQFDGVNQHFVTTCDLGWTNASTHTVEFFIKYVSNGATQTLFAQYDASDATVIMSIDNNHRLQCFAKKGVPSVWYRANAATDALVSGEYYHVAWTKNAGVHHLYINGIEPSYDQSTSSSLGDLALTNTISIAYRAGNSDLPFAGIMEFISIYNNVMSINDLQERQSNIRSSNYISYDPKITYDCIGSGTVNVMPSIASVLCNAVAVNSPVYIVSRLNGSRKRR